MPCPLVLALALSLGLVASVWAQPMGQGMGHGHGMMNLTPEQAGKIFDLNEKMYADTALRRQMMVKHEELAALLKAEKPDQNAIQGKQKELKALGDQILEKMTASRLEAKKIAPDFDMGPGPGWGRHGHVPSCWTPLRPSWPLTPRHGAGNSEIIRRTGVKRCLYETAIGPAAFFISDHGFDYQKIQRTMARQDMRARLAVGYELYPEKINLLLLWETYPSRQTLLQGQDGRPAVCLRGLRPVGDFQGFAV